MLEIKDLQTEHMSKPQDVDSQNPRFSWKIISNKNDVIQESYHIFVKKGDEIVWDSGEVKSDQSLYIKYAGPKLEKSTDYSWSVEVAAGSEKATASAEFRTTLSDRDWMAQWIQPVSDYENPDEYYPAPIIKKDFQIRKNIKRARIYQTAHGLYEFWINGMKGSKDLFKPGFTSYHKRLQYQSYDITNLLVVGHNEWKIILADGWWRGMTGGLYRNNFGFKLAFLGQIVIEYIDGSKEIIATNESFLTQDSNYKMADMQFGTIYDATKENHNWRHVSLLTPNERYYHTLIPTRSVPVRAKESFEAKIFKDTKGNTVLDFGQNIAGYVKMTLRDLERGQKVTLIHSEGLKNGAFDNSNITDSVTFKTTEHYQQVDYIASGEKIEEFEPTFSVFGFRYAVLKGYDEEKIRPHDFVAVAIYSDLEPTGDFKCSNPLINQLVSNSRWSQKGNFLDVPTDCPTRERSPWTGDSQVYAKTATLFMDVYPFFEKWLLDLNEEQFEDGMIGCTVPCTNTMLHNEKEVTRLYAEDKLAIFPPGIVGKKAGLFDGSTGWGDTAVITPYTMYLTYGDKKILENQYDSAKKWVDYMINEARKDNPDRIDSPEYHNETNGQLDAHYIFDTHFHYGEWLEPVSKESGSNEEFNPEEEKKTTNALVASAYLFYSSHLLSEMARILDNKDDEAYYHAYSEHTKKVYNKYFIQDDGTIVEGRQAPYVRALQFDLVSEDKKPLVVKKLVEEVRKNDMRLNTGFLSTPFLLRQLSENSFINEAFEVLEQTKSPSWLYPITLGATTILEDWTGMETHTNSYNHYSYGAVCDFLFSEVCGIKPSLDAPGYKEFTIKPTVGGSLKFAKAYLNSPYGLIKSEWKKENGDLKFKVVIPANTHAQIELPNGQREYKGSGTFEYTLSEYNFN